MFLYVDESGRSEFWDPQNYFLITVLRFTTRKSFLRLQQEIRRARKDFETYLRKTGQLPNNKSVPFLSGATKARGKQPGFAQHPKQFRAFLERVAPVFNSGRDCQLYVIGFQRNLKQTIPGDEVGSNSSRRGPLTKVRIYSMLLGSLLSSIRPFPRLTEPKKTFKPNANEKNRIPTRRRAILVVDANDHPRIARRAFCQRCMQPMTKKNKLRGARLHIWFNRDQDDLCVQLVDLLSNFFFQARRLGLAVVKPPGQTVRFARVRPLQGATVWTQKEWKEAFSLIEPSLDTWKSSRWLFRPARRLVTPTRRETRRNTGREGSNPSGTAQGATSKPK